MRFQVTPKVLEKFSAIMAALRPKEEKVPSDSLN